MARDPKTRGRLSLGVGIAILLVFFALSLETGNWILICWTVPVGTVTAGIVYLRLHVLSANPPPEPWTAMRKRRASWVTLTDTERYWFLASISLRASWLCPCERSHTCLLGPHPWGHPSA